MEDKVMRGFWKIVKFLFLLEMAAAHSDEADQSVRSDADQCGAKRRRALLVWNSDRHPSTVFCSFPQLLHS
jgi:hypothetical protein